MKSSSKKVNGHQPEKGKRRKDKKKTDIRWNSAIFFQVGLIIALISSVYAMDLKVGEKSVNPPEPITISLDEPFIMGDFTIEKDKPKVIEKSKPVAKVEKKVVVKPKITDVIKKVDDDAKIEESKVATTETDNDAKVNDNKDTTVTTNTNNDKGTKTTGNSTININSVEFVPIFPGCESLSTNKERIDCMSQKISKFVSRKFRTHVADEETKGKQRITVQFKINKLGEIDSVRAVSKDKALAKEAQRVINRLPLMTPGRQGDTSVDVVYMLPITFQVK